MEFLSRSWSPSSLQLSKPTPLSSSSSSFIHSKPSSSNSIPEEQKASTSTTTCVDDDENGLISEELSNNNNQLFCFANCSASSQLLLQRIMSQSTTEEEVVSPELTSGRESQSSEALMMNNGGGGCLTGTGTDDNINSPPNSDEFDDVVKFFRSNNSIHPLFNGGRAMSSGIGNATPCSGPKTVGRWLKERREKKKEENRTHNAQLHAAVSVAAVAAAVAAVTAATAASSATNKDEKMAKTDMAVASAATLVAAQCVEAAEEMGAEREHLASVISSAVNVHSHDDITTLTAAAATALRGAATLKARALKEVWSISSVTPLERGIGIGICGGKASYSTSSTSDSGEIIIGDNFLGASNLEVLAKGTELLKRTRKGDLHWKIVSVYIHRTGQVMLKMKSKHVAGTITKKKKNVVLDVCTNLPAWPGRHLFDDGEKRRYFGLKTESRGIVEFECRNQREHDIWTQGVSKLLSIAAERQNRSGV